MRVGTITLRLGDLLVVVAGDSDAALDALRTRFGAWIDTAHPDITPAFDLRLDTGAGASAGAPRAVPQLRYGGTLLARSRSAVDVVDALDAVLGGVLAHQDRDGVRIFLRPFVAGGRMVLVDADAPMLVNDPGLAKQGVVELPTWSSALLPPATDDAAPVIEVAAPLSDPGRVTRYELAGVVGVCSAISRPATPHCSLAPPPGTPHSTGSARCTRWWRAAVSSSQPTAPTPAAPSPDSSPDRRTRCAWHIVDVLSGWRVGGRSWPRGRPGRR